MSKPTVVVPDDYPPVLGPSAAFRSLEARAQVGYHPSLPPSAEVLVNIRSSVGFDEEVFVRCPRLRALSLWGTGTDHVDLEAAARHGVAVTNTPGVSAVAMAEHALALMLAVARDIPRIDARTRRGAWPRGFVTQLHGRVLGVVGLGAIGMQTARIMGSAALGLSYAATGRTDLYFHHQLEPWDQVAGILLAEEAGGVVTDRTGRRAGLYSDGIVVSNRVLHSEFMRRTEGMAWRQPTTAVV